MFEALKPQRVHPLVPQDSDVTTIPMDILNEYCEIIDDSKDDLDADNPSYNTIDMLDNSEHSMQAEKSFLALSDEVVLTDYSTENDDDVPGTNVIRWLTSM